jgi:hypothetical protein
MNAGHYYSNIVMPQEIDLSFTVDATNGLGITGLKSNGWANNVFMHTSTTPSANNGVTNPNPAAGIIIVQLKQNFNVFLGMRWNVQAPTTGGTVTSLTTNTAYVINSVGTTTQAQWNTAGLPAGFTPAVGQTFIAAATASLSGSGNVKAVAASSVASIEVFGDPSTMLSNSAIATNSGAYLYFQVLDYAGALVAPTASSVINLGLYFDRSSVTVDGL